jgi:hypothetical protein
MRIFGDHVTTLCGLFVTMLPHWADHSWPCYHIVRAIRDHVATLCSPFVTMLPPCADHAWLWYHIVLTIRDHVTTLCWPFVTMLPHSADHSWPCYHIALTIRDHEVNFLWRSTKKITAVTLVQFLEPYRAEFVTVLPYYADLWIIFDSDTIYCLFVTMLPYFTFNERSCCIKGGYIISVEMFVSCV